jgi:hypothetical protein
MTRPQWAVARPLAAATEPMRSAPRTRTGSAGGERREIEPGSEDAHLAAHGRRGADPDHRAVAGFPGRRPVNLSSTIWRLSCPDGPCNPGNPSEAPRTKAQDPTIAWTVRQERPDKQKLTFHQRMQSEVSSRPACGPEGPASSYASPPHARPAELRLVDRGGRNRNGSGPRSRAPCRSPSCAPGEYPHYMEECL